MSITRELAREAAWHCKAIQEHAAVAWYDEERGNRYHLTRVCEELEAMARKLGYRVEKIGEPAE